jgi:hypothetical protein
MCGFFSLQEMLRNMAQFFVNQWYQRIQRWAVAFPPAHE